MKKNINQQKSQVNSKILQYCDHIKEICKKYKDETDKFKTFFEEMLNSLIELKFLCGNIGSDHNSIYFHLDSQNTKNLQIKLENSYDVFSFHFNKLVFFLVFPA